MEKKRLLIATDNFLPRWDGIARFLSELIPFLIDDFEIVVLAPDFPGEYHPEGFQVVRFPLSKINVGDYTLAKADKKIVRKHVAWADIIFTQTLGPIGAAAIRLGSRRSKPIITYTHSLEWELVAKSISPWRAVETMSYWLLKKYVKYHYNKCSLIMVPYLELGEILRTEGITPLQSVVHLGVNTEKFRPVDDPKLAKENLNISASSKVIGFSGRIAREKDLITLYRAFKRLEKSHTVKLIIIGDGLEDLKALFRKEKNILMAGHVQDVIPYLQAMDIFVLPSLTETTSLATLEAMACGLPVIATRVGYLKYYIKNKQNGLFFSKRNNYLASL